MKIENLPGILIFISFLLTFISYFYIPSILIFAGLFAWAALILLFKEISNFKLVSALLFLSFLAFAFSYINDFDINIQRSITVNQYLLTLLIGVGFLRLIATPKKSRIKSLPKGKDAFFKTYLGIHLFGSVINLSSLILVADKFYEKANLTRTQVIVLTRAFSSDAYWSPFFVAFAAASTYANGFDISIILFIGVILALVACFVTFLELKRSDYNEFVGYPIHFETLYIPVILALIVIIANYFYPNSKTILFISLFSLILTVIILPMKVGIKSAFKNLNTHIKVELPKMKNEISLFLVAGMFGVSISSILLGYNISLPFDNFDGVVASIFLLILILLSFVGIHPIISIAVVGSWTNDLNHTLLAMAFLMSWATSVSTSPFSGLNLTMNARYNLDAINTFKINLPYAIKMYIICVIILLLLSNYLGL